MYRPINKYLLTLIIALIIVFFFFVLPYFYLPIELNSIFIAIGGLLFSIPIGYFWHVFTQPILQISKQVKIVGGVSVISSYECRESKESWIYNANRIIIENIGRSSAKNCKGWIITPGGKERVCWTVPNERPNATINVKDAEQLDFCAYRESGPDNYTDIGGEKKIVPRVCFSDENNLPSTIQTAKLKSLDDLTECRVQITSDNAEPIEARVIIQDDKIWVEP